MTTSIAPFTDFSSIRSFLVSGQDLSGYFKKLLSNLELNDTFGTAIQQHHQSVRAILETRGLQNLRTQLIGSLQRKTRIQPRTSDKFDIDILVELGSFYNWTSSGGINPEQALEYVHNVITNSQRYENMGPRQDRPAISFAYESNVYVELVPAYKDQIGKKHDGTLITKNISYWIPKQGGWQLADYDQESAYCSLINQQYGGRIIPTIKILKAIKRERLNFTNFDSFHLEMLAIKILPGIILARQIFRQEINYPILIEQFFLALPAHTSGELLIPGSHADAQVLTPVVQVLLNLESSKITREIAKTRMVTNIGDRISIWRGIIGDVFPTVI